MIEINLLPKPEPLDPRVKQLLNVPVAILLDECYLRFKRATTPKEELAWGRVWASILLVRQEILGITSQADSFCQDLIVSGTIDDLENY